MTSFCLSRVSASRSFQRHPSLLLPSKTSPSLFPPAHPPPSLSGPSFLQTSPSYPLCSRSLPYCFTSRSLMVFTPFALLSLSVLTHSTPSSPVSLFTSPPFLCLFLLSENFCYPQPAGSQSVRLRLKIVPLKAGKKRKCSKRGEVEGSTEEIDSLPAGSAANIHFASTETFASLFFFVKSLPLCALPSHTIISVYFYTSPDPSLSHFVSSEHKHQHEGFFKSRVRGRCRQQISSTLPSFSLCDLQPGNTAGEQEHITELILYGTEHGLHRKKHCFMHWCCWSGWGGSTCARASQVVVG